MKIKDKELNTLQSALEKLTLEETVALTREFERILTTRDVKTTKQREETRRKQEPVDSNGRVLKVGQLVETPVRDQRVHGRVKRLGKQISIEPRNRPIIVQAFHNVTIVEKSEK